MRVVRFVPLVLGAALSIAACSGGERPGWTYAPAPSGSAAASGEPSASAQATEGTGGSPSLSPGPSGTPATSPSGATGTTLELVAENVAYDTKELSAPAGQPFSIHFVQRDAGVGGHDVDIRTSDGTVVQDNEPVAEPGETTYTIQPLEAGEYVFICSIHPIANMTGTLTVE